MLTDAKIVFDSSQIPGEIIDLMERISRDEPGPRRAGRTDRPQSAIFREL
jgi:hypothetical protein